MEDQAEDVAFFFIDFSVFKGEPEEEIEFSKIKGFVIGEDGDPSVVDHVQPTGSGIFH
jgi:hypothetical protein